MKMVRTMPPAIIHSGLIGFGKDETVRLNVVSLGGPDTRPRRVQSTFFDADGNVVKRAEMEIAPGQSSSMDVGFQEVENTPVPSVARKQLRMELVGFNPQPDPPGLIATLEIFSTKTGDTRFISDPQVG
jgi:hypothetical protein